jgi:MFS family permease
MRQVFLLTLLAPVSALMLGVATLLVGNGLLGTLLPVRAGIEQFPTIAIGIMGSTYFVGFVGGCLLGPRLVQRAGHIRTFTAMVAIASALALVHLLAVEPVVWWAARGAAGFCFACIYLVVESWLNERATNNTRGTILSVYTMINLLAITGGQFLLTLYDPASFPLFVLVSMIFSLGAVPVALTRAPSPAPLSTVRLRPLRLYKLSPVGFGGCFAVGLANGAFWMLAPLFVAESGRDISAIAEFMAFTIVAGALAQWPFGRVSDHMDRRYVLAVAAGLSALAGIALVFASHAWPGGLLVSAALFGAFSFPMYSLCVAHANDVMEREEFVEASSGLLLANGLGSALAPTIASLAMTKIGPSGLFLYTAVIHAAMIVFVLHRMRRRAVLPGEHERFVPLAEATPTVVTLDPRSDETAVTPERP